MKVGVGLGRGKRLGSKKKKKKEDEEEEEEEEGRRRRRRSMRGAEGKLYITTPDQPPHGGITGSSNIRGGGGGQGRGKKWVKKTDIKKFTYKEYI